MNTLLSNHAWYEFIGPVTLIAAFLLCYWYVNSLVKSPQYNVTRTQKRYFFTAVILFYLMEGSPLSVIADNYLVSALLFQLSVMAFVVVPLFILSLPEQYLRIFFWHHKWAKVARFLFRHPWPLAVIFNGLVTTFLIPSLFDAIHGNLLFQFFYEVLLVTFAFLTWWVIIQPSDEVANNSYLIRVIYVFFMALFLMPIGIFLIVAQDPMYTAYAPVAGELFPALTALYDQQLAGGVLKFLQLGSYSIALFYLLKQWGLTEEEREGEVDENTRVVQGIAIKLNDRNRRKRGKKR